MKASMEDIRRPLLYSCGTSLLGDKPKRKKKKRDPPPTAISLDLGKRQSTFVLSNEDSETHLGKEKTLDRRYLRKIASDISFGEDVFMERCQHLMPYRESFLDDVYSSESLVPQPPKRKHVVHGCRHDHKTATVHLPCLSTARCTPWSVKLPPVLPSSPLSSTVSPDSVRRSVVTLSEKEKEQGDLEKGVFLTEAPQLQATLPQGGMGDQSRTTAVKETKRVDKIKEEGQMKKKKKKDNDWDEALLSYLSKNTAQYLIQEKTDIGKQRDRLSNLLTDWYGQAPAMVDLAPEDPLQFDNTESSPPLHAINDATKRRKSWEKDTPIMKLLSDEIAETRQTDPYGDVTAASFYRLPVGLREERKEEEREKAIQINRTAASIQVKTRVPTPPPTMRDLLPAGVGQKVYDTDNPFEREMLAGVHQLFHPEDPSRIVMASHNEYVRELRPCVPPMADEGDGKENIVHRQKRGFQRWQTLPQAYDEREVQLKKKKSKGVLPKGKGDLKEEEMEERKRTRANTYLMQTVEEWRAKWRLNQKYADSSVEDILRDMTDLQASVRLQAIITVSKAASYNPQPSEGIELDPPTSEVVGLLPDRLFQALDQLVDDVHAQVRKAAAICLFTLRRTTPRAEGLLRSLVKGGSGINAVDRWAAAQCLAHYGANDSEVVSELVNQLMSSEDALVHGQATHLLAEVSKTTRLVHALLAEKLNSNSWRCKVMACKALPALFGSINKDLLQKLSTTMWTDWHSEVRIAAAQALGKTGHGRDMHDDLLEKLTDPCERIRTDAINKLGFLGIMTAKLMPVFLELFSDSYASVRQEVCIACSRLEISDRRCLEKLVFLAVYEPLWRIKAHAIQALGVIGVSSPAIRDCLVWALRYETEAAVRAEACHAAQLLGILDDEVANILRDRYLVETSALVKREITSCLESLGISPLEDIDMVRQIKAEVRRLNKKEYISDKILTLEHIEDTALRRMEMLADEPKRAPSTASVSAAIDRTSTAAAEEELEVSGESRPVTRELERLTWTPFSLEGETRPATTLGTSRKSFQDAVDREKYTPGPGSSESPIARSSSRATSFSMRASSAVATGKSSAATTAGKTRTTEDEDDLEEDVEDTEEDVDKEKEDAPNIQAMDEVDEMDETEAVASDEKPSPMHRYPYERKPSQHPYHLAKIDPDISPLPPDRAATLASSTQSPDSFLHQALPDTALLPLTDEVRSDLVNIEKFEGLDLGPWIEDKRPPPKREPKHKKKPSKKKHVKKAEAPDESQQPKADDVKPKEVDVKLEDGKEVVDVKLEDGKKDVEGATKPSEKEAEVEDSKSDDVNEKTGITSHDESGEVDDDKSDSDGESDTSSSSDKDIKVSSRGPVAVSSQSSTSSNKSPELAEGDGGERQDGCPANDVIEAEQRREAASEGHVDSSSEKDSDL